MNHRVDAWLIADFVVVGLVAIGIIVVAICSLPGVRAWRVARRRPAFVPKHAKRVPLVIVDQPSPSIWPDEKRLIVPADVAGDLLRGLGEGLPDSDGELPPNVQRIR